MRKIGLCILMTVFMCISPVMNVFADDTLIPYNSEMPDEAVKPRVVDAGDLLTDNEETTLLAHLDDISTRHKCDVIVLTTDSLEGMRTQDFADDYFDYNGFGIGEERDGILLVVSMGEREWAFSTSGYGISAFTDNTLEYMEELVLPYLSDGDYYGAFLTYADQADAALEHARELETGVYEEGKENPYYENNKKTSIFTKLKSLIGLIPISIIIGTVIAFIHKQRALKQYSGIIHNKRSLTKSYASNMRLTKDQILPVGRGVHRTHRPRNKSNNNRSGSSRQSHVGRSSVHRSSSGRSHGGRSGKF